MDPLPNYPLYQEHRRWMALALELAAAAGAAGEVPVGAVIVSLETGRAIAQGENRRERDHDPTAHAEIVALRQAGEVLGRWRLEDCRLYVTLEPCPMCAGALLQARLGELVYGVDDFKAGAIRTVLNIPDSPASLHRLKVVGGIHAEACRHLLQDWFQLKRKPHRWDISE